jgi:hypothetical protein
MTLSAVKPCTLQATRQDRTMAQNIEPMQKAHRHVVPVLAVTP